MKTVKCHARTGHHAAQCAHSTDCCLVYVNVFVRCVWRELLETDHHGHSQRTLRRHAWNARDAKHPASTRVTCTRRMYHSVATRSCCSTCEGARLPALLKHAHVRPRAEALWLLAVLAARLVSCLWSLRRAPARCCHQLASSCVQPRAAARALSSCGRLGASCPSLGRSARAAATGGSRLLVRQPPRRGGCGCGRVLRDVGSQSDVSARACATTLSSPTR